MNTVKIDRAFGYSKVGRYTSTANTAWSYIPSSVYAKLSGKQLAELMDAFYRAFENTKAIHERDICQEGVIWDERIQKLREIA